MQCRAVEVVLSPGPYLIWCELKWGDHDLQCREVEQRPLSVDALVECQ